METVSIKALSRKVLQGNCNGNSRETVSFLAGKLKDKFPDEETCHRNEEHSAIMERNWDLSKDQAIRVACRIYSQVLDAFLWVVCNGPKDLKALRGQGITEVIYTGQDIEQLKKLPKTALKSIHSAKEVFPMAIIEGISITRGEIGGRGNQ